MKPRRRRAMRLVFGAAVIALVVLSALFVMNRWRWVDISYTTKSAFGSLTVSNDALWYRWAEVPAFEGSEGFASGSATRRSPQDSQFTPTRWWPVLGSEAKSFEMAVPLWMLALPAAGVAAWAGVSLCRRAGERAAASGGEGSAGRAASPEGGRVGANGSDRV